MMQKVAFYPSLLYNVFMEKVTTRNWYNRIDEAVILGALPFKSMTKKLVGKEGITGVLTMNEEYETRLLCNSKEEWSDAGVEQLRLALPDFVAAPTCEQLTQGVNFIQKHKDIGGCVYVHCKAGRTRSACFVAAYLMQTHDWTPEAAKEHILSKRPHSWLREKQMQALLDFQKIPRNGT